ncbi:SurA N-terminal domain-containing protein [Nonomuraea fuscirosea]|uniref:SurA N-terminal domain-containing protein n=1 Tax=Nonomuraea fuscirosea TaxID=1291556 RepID=UPI000D06CA81|nr:SurA N-terminal domain-containing protein [Nonomuraea fuscirosea]WSA52827.1 SurA N-terminal domain-containing protein [Nonomuraea fuscirosea]
MKSIRVAVTAAAVVVGLTACSSPMHAGAAAVVGNERISTSELSADTRAYLAALKQNQLDEQALGVPATQVVLQRLVNVSISRQLMARYNVRVSETEIDAALKDPGQFESPQINLLANGVSPNDARDYGRVMVGLSKLQQQFGGESGQQKLSQEFASIKPVFNPRYGALNPQRSQQNPALFLDTGRFGKQTSDQAQQQQPQG